MLGMHRRCFPKNFRKIFQNAWRLLLTFKIYKVLSSKKRKIVVTLEIMVDHFFRFMFPENPENSSVF